MALTPPAELIVWAPSLRLACPLSATISPSATTSLFTCVPVHKPHIAYMPLVVNGAPVVVSFEHDSVRACARHGLNRRLVHQPIGAELGLHLVAYLPPTGSTRARRRRPRITRSSGQLAQQLIPLYEQVTAGQSAQPQNNSQHDRPVLSMSAFSLSKFGSFGLAASAVFWNSHPAPCQRHVSSSARKHPTTPLRPHHLVQLRLPLRHRLLGQFRWSLAPLGSGLRALGRTGPTAVAVATAPPACCSLATT
jgi:hypothetical protein